MIKGNNKIVPILLGLIKTITLFNRWSFKETGGTVSADYCYSVWLRHLNFWKTVRSDMPKIVAELGPGDSLGTSLAALLSGVDKVVVLDVVKYWDEEKNMVIFEELIKLFKDKKDIPGKEVFPRLRPKINNYYFPSDIITDIILKKSLAKNRLNQIRKELADVENPKNKYILCQIPWDNDELVRKNSVDFVFSQAVMEYVEDLGKTYKVIKKWLKPGALMSHTIDFKSDRITKNWNGHWTFSKFQWKIIKGSKKVIINRAPLTKHIELIKKCNFEICQIENVKAINTLKRSNFSDEFRLLEEIDLCTSGTYILARKIGSGIIKCY